VRPVRTVILSYTGDWPYNLKRAAAGLFGARRLPVCLKVVGVGNSCRAFGARAYLQKAACGIHVHVARSIKLDLNVMIMNVHFMSLS